MLLVVGSACAFCWPVFAGRVMLPADMCLLMLPWNELRSQFPEFYRPHNPMFDPIQQYLPWRIYAVESLRAGFIPLWNPYAFCGTPFLANLQSTVLYPPNVLFLLTGARHGFGVSAIVHLSLGGLFMYAFLRTLALSPAASLLGALVLMFNGFTVTWLEFPTLSLWVFMWLPALLLCCERALRSPRSVWPGLCALVVGVQLLGGHLQVSAYLMLACVLYGLVRIVGVKGTARHRAGAAGLLVVSIAVGMLLAAAQVLPTLELAKHSGRVTAEAGAAVRTAFPLTHLILYLVPNFFGNPVHYNYWGDYQNPGVINFFETACYVGVLPLLLGAWSLRLWRRREVVFFGALTLLAVLAAIGSPLYLLLHKAIPGFRELAGLGRVLCLAAFGLAGLAAVGLDDLLGNKLPKRSSQYVIAPVLGLVWIAVACYEYQPLRNLLDASWRFNAYVIQQIAIAVALVILSGLLIGLRVRARLPAGGVGAVACLLLLADLFLFGLGFNPFVDADLAYPQTESTRWLQNHLGSQRFGSLASDRMDWMAHNSPMIFGLRDIHGSDSLRVRRSFELVSGPTLDQAHYPPADSPLLDALGVRYLMTRQQAGDSWRLAYPGKSPIYENTEAVSRARLVHNFRTGTDAEGRAALERGCRPGEEAILHPDGPGIELGRPAAAAVGDPTGTVVFVRDAPNEVVIETESAAPALLILSDSYYPGWRAHIYEALATVVRTNYAFRGIAVPAGRQVVTLRYEPASFRVGLCFSLLALSLLSAWMTAAYLAASDRTSKTASRS
jgi:hypothetical protein